MENDTTDTDNDHTNENDDKNGDHNNDGTNNNDNDNHDNNISNNDEINQIYKGIKETKDIIEKFNIPTMKENFQKIEDRIRNLEQKIDDNVNTGLHHPTHIYTWEEIKNICIRSFAQGVSFYFAYIILGLLYDRILKKQNANTTTTTTTNNNNNNNK